MTNLRRVQSEENPHYWLTLTSDLPRAEEVRIKFLYRDQKVLHYKLDNFINNVSLYQRIKSNGREQKKEN